MDQGGVKVMKRSLERGMMAEEDLIDVRMVEDG